MLPESPYQQLLHSALEERGARIALNAPLRASWAIRLGGQIDVVHLHWLEYLVGSNDRETLKPARMIVRGLRLLATLALLRARGVRVVWTVHNLTPHDALLPKLDLALARACARLSNRLVVHSRYAASSVALAYGARDAIVAYHGNFVDYYPAAAATREQVRSRLGIPVDAHVFLAFGQVRAYKRLPELVQAVRGLPRDDVRLLVAGRPIPAAAGEAIAAAADGDPRIVLRLEHIADGEVAALHEASDVAVMPNREVFSSGALLLALSLGVPVIARTPSTAGELAPPPAVQPYGPGALSEALLASMELDRATTRAAALRAAADYPWDRTARAVLEAYGVTGRP
ncbi:MAG TPA: glycosyltransferase [Solirubrobacteraceae bacterium]|jgi:glycosyltransferase involved in cell wall biosynthesis